MTTSELAAKAKGAARMTATALKGQAGIFSTLAKEHGEVSSLFKQALASDDKDELAEVARRIRVELLSHARGEERTFYAALATHPETAPLVTHAKHEHEEAEKAFTQLEGLIIGSSDWKTALATLCDSVQRHVAEEESDLFERAQEVFSGDERQRIDEAFKLEKHALRERLAAHTAVPGRY